MTSTFLYPPFIPRHTFNKLIRNWIPSRHQKLFLDRLENVNTSIFSVTQNPFISFWSLSFSQPRYWGFFSLTVKHKDTSGLGNSNPFLSISIQFWYNLTHTFRAREEGLYSSWQPLRHSSTSQNGHRTVSEVAVVANNHQPSRFPVSNTLQMLLTILYTKKHYTIHLTWVL